MVLANIQLPKLWDTHSEAQSSSVADMIDAFISNSVPIQSVLSFPKPLPIAIAPSSPSQLRSILTMTVLTSSNLRDGSALAIEQADSAVKSLFPSLSVGVTDVQRPKRLQAASQ